MWSPGYTRDEKEAYKAGLRKGRKLEAEEHKPYEALQKSLDYLQNELNDLVATFQDTADDLDRLVTRLSADDTELQKAFPVSDPIKAPCDEMLAGLETPEEMVEHHLRKIQFWLKLPQNGLLTTETEFRLHEALMTLFQRRS